MRIIKQNLLPSFGKDMNGFIFRLSLWTGQVSSVTFAFFLSIMKVFVSRDKLIAFLCFAFPTVRARLGFFWGFIFRFIIFFWIVLPFRTTAAIGFWVFTDKWLRMRASNVIPLAWRAPVAEVDFSTVFTLSPVVRFASVPTLKCYLFLISDTSEGTLVISCVVNSNPCPNKIIRTFKRCRKRFMFLVCFVFRLLIGLRHNDIIKKAIT